MYRKIIKLMLLTIIILTNIKCTKRIAPEESSEKLVDFAIVIHGGAGSIKKGMYSQEQENNYRTKLTNALTIGYNILKEGGSSLDAVQKVIIFLEDSPEFNAGKGAVFNADGIIELDASIMEGKTKMAGAVAGVHHIKNPITLARLVMEKSPHVLLAGDGAEKFAVEHGVELIDTSYFFTRKSWNRLQQAQEKEMKKGVFIEPETSFSVGTVGCVALDKESNLAAGTSTGGMTNKRYGRIGDSPIIGAGTYADNNTCAVSATGHGEYFIRNVVAYDVAALMNYENTTLKDAAESVIYKKLQELGGSGGIIAIDSRGNISMPYNTGGMFRGFITDDGIPVVKIFKDNDEKNE
jgi:beta-aspartyl-peptidase (threonine type)